eukprot:scaffold343_cov245-Pinguiococcus_pyrenoidosus.AAC.1
MIAALWSPSRTYLMKSSPRVEPAPKSSSTTIRSIRALEFSKMSMASPTLPASKNDQLLWPMRASRELTTLRVTRMSSTIRAVRQPGRFFRFCIRSCTIVRSFGNGFVQDSVAPFAMNASW